MITVVRTRLKDERPFGGGGVPVELAHNARFKLHRHAGDPFRDRQLFDRGLFAKTVAEIFPGDFSSSNLNVGSSFPASNGSGILF